MACNSDITADDDSENQHCCPLLLLVIPMYTVAYVRPSRTDLNTINVSWNLSMASRTDLTMTDCSEKRHCRPLLLLVIFNTTSADV